MFCPLVHWLCHRQAANSKLMTSLYTGSESVRLGHSSKFSDKTISLLIALLGAVTNAVFYLKSEFDATALPASGLVNSADPVSATGSLPVSETCTTRALASSMSFAASSTISGSKYVLAGFPGRLGLGVTGMSTARDSSGNLTWNQLEQLAPGDVRVGLAWMMLYLCIGLFVKLCHSLITGKDSDPERWQSQSKESTITAASGSTCGSLSGIHMHTNPMARHPLGPSPTRTSTYQRPGDSEPASASGPGGPGASSVAGFNLKLQVDSATGTSNTSATASPSGME
jgi:hypothetical protein